MNFREALNKVGEQGFDHVLSWTDQPHLLHRAMGFSDEAGLGVGSGHSYDYTDKDVLTAVMYLRAIRVLGVNSTKDKVSRQVADLGANHDTGYIVLIDGNLGWTNDTKLKVLMKSTLKMGWAFLVIPCGYIEVSGRETDRLQ